MSAETRARFEQVLDQAPALGIDRAAADAGGPVALRALLALIKAKASEPGSGRARYLVKVQESLGVLEHRNHPELVQQIQKAVMALHGRQNDTEVAHVTRGEIVVPLQLQTEDVLAALGRAAQPYGVPLDMLRVGTALNRINPEAGAPEFGVIDWIAGRFEKDDKGNASQPTNQKAPKIKFSPPFSDPAVAAEEEKAVRDHLRENPFERHPILSGVTSIAESIRRWSRKGEPQVPPNAIGHMPRS